jgi:hypothetical protein
MILKEEKNKCLDYQLIKGASWHNDMTVMVVDQYEKPIPFFSIPLGGVPSFKPSINVRK